MKKISLLDWVDLSRYESAPLEKMRYEISSDLGWFSMGGDVGDRVVLMQKLARELDTANEKNAQLSGNPADNSPLDRLIKSSTNWREKRKYWRKK